MKKKILLTTILAFSFVLGSILPIKASYDSAEELVDKAILQKSFYYYNEAYNEIMKLKGENEKTTLLEKLSSIGGEIWSDDIKNINNIITQLASTGSGKLYDEVQLVISNASIPEIDKSYLLGEVTTWGQRLVWTEDYNQAIEVLGDAWIKKDSNSVSKAEGVINNVKNEHSRSYLLSELEGLKSFLSNSSVGDMKNPISLVEKQSFVLKTASFIAAKDIELQILEVKRGDEASSFVEKKYKSKWSPESMKTENLQWIVMKFNLKYIDGPEQLLLINNVIDPYYNLFSSIGDKIMLYDKNTFTVDDPAFGLTELDINQESVFYCAILVEKSLGDPLIKIGTGLDSENQLVYKWFKVTQN